MKLPREVLTILGADDSTRMLLRKPCYGQIDAPRRWFLEATRRLIVIGLRPHILDSCAFLICITATDSSKCLGAERIVGMICIHVDDMLGVPLKNRWCTRTLPSNFAISSTSVSGRARMNLNILEPLFRRLPLVDGN